MMRLRISSPRNFVGVKSKGVFGEDCAVTLIGLGKKMNKDIEMRNGQIVYALSLSLLVKWRKATGLSKPPHRPSWPDDLALTILVKPVYDYW